MVLSDNQRHDLHEAIYDYFESMGPSFESLVVSFKTVTGIHTGIFKY